ncbi:hypothetical protein WA158_002156 [Blastocystis sp. Blastoise]
MVPTAVRYFEVVFDIAYLITIFTMSILMFVKPKTNLAYKGFGLMALLLGLGDSFHLVPRIIANIKNDFESMTVPLDWGKFISGITMTFFYDLLYEILRQRYQINERGWFDYVYYILTVGRVLQLCDPRNEWFSKNTNMMLQRTRNICFTIMGIMIIVYSYIVTHNTPNDSLRYLWISITLSFVFYAVVVYLPQYKFLGFFMMPKTLAYVWLVIMCYMTGDEMLEKLE